MLIEDQVRETPCVSLLKSVAAWAADSVPQAATVDLVFVGHFFLAKGMDGMDGSCPFQNSAMTYP